jgi:hypothetical protein
LAALPGVTHVVGNSHKPILGQLTLKVLDEAVSRRTHGPRRHILQRYLSGE